MANDTFLVQSDEHQMLINRTIPLGGDTDEYDKCHVYSTEGVAYDQFNHPINASLVPCESWVYDRSVFRSTFTDKVFDPEILFQHRMFILP